MGLGRGCCSRIAVGEPVASPWREAGVREAGVRCCVVCQAPTSCDLRKGCPFW